MNSKALAVLASLWLPAVASATEGDATSKLDTLSQKLEKILATQGISFAGQFRGEFGASDISGDGVAIGRRTGEQIGYTSIDFDLRARPNTLTQARAVFRMHLDHASFFGSPYTPLETRWLSLDGKTSDGIFFYHLGNFQQKWSPLTMWSPEPGFVYTPRIFAQQQKQAMDERFLGGNARNLQGADFGIRAAVPAAKIDSFNVSFLAAKLLTAAPIGSPASSYTSQVNLSGDGATGYPDSLANYDRWLLGGRGVVTFLSAITAGASFQVEKDLKSTYGSTDSTHDQQVVRDTTAPAQNGRVISGQLGLDVAKLIGNRNLILGLDIEGASSSWDYLDDVNLDTNTNVVTTSFKAKSGMAIDAALKAGWKTESWSAKLTAGYLSVDSNYRADLAQTPIFHSNVGRVYNSEQDVWNGSSFNNLVHYNTFDALYHNVHHWTAESKGPQNEVAKIPYDKLAYSNYVAGWATMPLGAWTSSLNQAVQGQVAAAISYAGTKNTSDSLRALVGLGTAKSADSVRLGLKTGTTGYRTLTDSALLVTYKKTVGAAKLALYNAALNSGFDRDLQLVLPGGEATPNRVGPKLALDVDVLGGGIEVMANAYLLQEAKGTVLDSFTQLVPEKAKFQQAQGGLKFRLDRFVPGWNTLLKPKTPQPLELSVSGGQSTAKGGAWLDYKSTEMAGSLYAGLLPRLALLAGYQSITGKDNTLAGVDRNETNTAAGLEFKIQEGAYFLAMYNLLSTKYPNAPEFDFDQKIWSTKISVSF